MANLFLRKLKERFRLAAYSVRYLRHRLLGRQSYAADREDLAALTLLGRVDTFIDVGANDGFSLSNTALFALHGAKGMCFEPNPLDFRRLRAFYTSTNRVGCFQEAISDRAGIMEFRSDGLLSSITATEDAGLTKLLAPFQGTDSSLITVATGRLADWLDEYPDFRESDVLSIDVEGHELNVLLGVDWNRHPTPARCLIIETHSDGPDQRWRHRDYDAIDQLLTGHGYYKLLASANNTFWLRSSALSHDRVLAAKTLFPQYQWFDQALTYAA